MSDQARINELRAVMLRLVDAHAAQLVMPVDGNQGANTAELAEMFTTQITPFIDLAAEYTAHWYDELDPGLGHSATAEHNVENERLRGTAGWAYRAPGAATAHDRLLGAAQRAILDGSRDVVINNTKAEGAQWFRSAPENACRFCRVMTVAPELYETPLTRMPSHDHDCQCLAAPARPGHQYRHPGYVTGWVAAINAARHNNFRATVAALSRHSV